MNPGFPNLETRNPGFYVISLQILEGIIWVVVIFGYPKY